MKHGRNADKTSFKPTSESVCQCKGPNSWVHKQYIKSGPQTILTQLHQLGTTKNVGPKHRVGPTNNTGPIYPDPLTRWNRYFQGENKTRDSAPCICHPTHLACSSCRRRKVPNCLLKSKCFRVLRARATDRMLLNTAEYSVA